MINVFIIRNIKYLLVIILASFIGMIALCLVYIIPTEPMKKKVMELGEREWRQNEYLWDGVEGSYLNNYTDAFMLNTAICEGKGNTLEKANAAYSYEYTDNGVESFQSYLRQEEGYKIVPYARYWNGYLIVLKPLLLFFSYDQIRVMNLVVQTALLIVLIGLIWKFKTELVVPFICSIILMNPLAISMNMHSSVVYYILLCSLLFFFLNRPKIEKKMDIMFLFVGIIVSFFELLTYPLITLVYLLIFEESMRKETEGNLLQDIKRIVTYSWAWGVGYAGMWVIKWIISSVVLKDSIIADAVGQVLYRSSGSNIDGSSVGRLEVLWVNISDYFNKVTFCGLLISLVLLSFFVLISNKRNIRNDCFFIIKMLIIAFIPVVWLMVKTNHSYIHHWMTHRELAPSVFIVLIISEGLACMIKRRNSIQ